MEGEDRMKSVIVLFMSAFLASAGVSAARGSAAQKQPQLERDSNRRGHTTALLADEVRHELLTLPYYGVFDWLEAQILPDDTVVLRGQVTRPTLKSDAESELRRLESIKEIRNEIEVLPLSQMDDDIRLATYRSIFHDNSPLFQYSLRAVPPIHIMVKNGRVVLKGIVANAMHRELASMAARSVSGVFDVKNELQVEKVS
jgi:hyperosmotically inducible periplasmic protein